MAYIGVTTILLGVVVLGITSLNISPLSINLQLFIGLALIIVGVVLTMTGMKGGEKY